MQVRTSRVLLWSTNHRWTSMLLCYHTVCHCLLKKHIHPSTITHTFSSQITIHPCPHHQCHSRHTCVFFSYVLSFWLFTLIREIVACLIVTFNLMMFVLFILFIHDHVRYQIAVGPQRRKKFGGNNRPAFCLSCLFGAFPVHFL